MDPLLLLIVLIHDLRLNSLLNIRLKLECSTTSIYIIIIIPPISIGIFIQILINYTLYSITATILKFYPVLINKPVIFTTHYNIKHISASLSISAFTLISKIIALTIKYPIVTSNSLKPYPYILLPYIIILFALITSGKKVLVPFNLGAKLDTLAL